MKTALVTGCSTGIGLETAKALAARDFHVLAGARSPSDLEMLDGLHKGISAVKLDVTSDTDVDSALARLPTDSLDLLVNNAGISIVGAVETASMEEVRQIFDVNFFGAWSATQKALPYLRRARGKVINVTSVSGFVSVPGGAGYSASKFALEAFSDALRMELRPFGVAVVVVQPGQVKTPIHYKMITGIDADAAGPDAVYGPLMHALSGLLEGGVNSPTNPKEVADVVVEAALSASPKTRYPVGHDIPDWEHLRDLPDRERDAQILSLLGLS